MQPWKTPASILQVRRILTSYRHWLGHDLLSGALDLGAEQLADAAYYAPRTLLSHGNQGDPVLNYGNAATLALWGYSWDELTATPSRLTAEPMERSERQRFLEQVSSQGHVTDYRGVRIAKNGQRFWIEKAAVWNVLDEQGEKIGQAASFDSWKLIEP
ncbi:MEKHLA domain-containing protein [Pseudomonas turukhanskensis]|uniref:MEKHLA domain-containing protein n=1 Tax=Pseudomonas turukhanskensis TaxID=1806536 RepID=A0A9W6K207_9PSED|nr:MEKHLA domain-containing protein [Pseudomonas turukhanskensis]GLK87317.1 MEKHLA domain-containing protein [Pseudomonas turukhanskensis]